MKIIIYIIIKILFFAFVMWLFKEMAQDVVQHYGCIDGAFWLYGLVMASIFLVKR